MIQNCYMMESINSQEGFNLQCTDCGKPPKWAGQVWWGGWVVLTQKDIYNAGKLFFIRGHSDDSKSLQGKAEPWLYTDYGEAQQLKQICKTLNAVILSILFFYFGERKYEHCLISGLAALAQTWPVNYASIWLRSRCKAIKGKYSKSLLLQKGIQPS